MIDHTKLKSSEPRQLTQQILFQLLDVVNTRSLLRPGAYLRTAELFVENSWFDEADKLHRLACGAVLDVDEPMERRRLYCDAYDKFLATQYKKGTINGRRHSAGVAYVENWCAVVLTTGADTDTRR
jgi:hypothetical protein